MAIRTRRPIVPSGALPAFLSSRQWSGIWPWAVTTLCGAEIFSLLAAFAWRGTNGRLPDVTTVLVAVPASVFITIIVIAVAWRWLAGIPLTSGLSFATRILPLAWIIPIADLIRSAGRGFIALPTPLDAKQFFEAVFTGALLPASSAVPMGMRVGIFAAVLITAFVVWFTRQNLLRSAVAALIASVTLVKLSFLPTALGLWEFLLRTGRWVSGTVETQREALRAVTNGYWWNNLYDRFPSSVEAQADLALRLTTAGIIVLMLGAVLVAVFVWLVPSRGRTLRHIFRAWSAADVLLYVVGAAIITRMAGVSAIVRGTWWDAALLGLLVLAALRVHAVLERCLHALPPGVEALAPGDPSEGPVACGDIEPKLASAISRIAFAFAFAASWTLGWPVFAAVIGFLAASFLSRSSFWSDAPWAATIFRAFGAAALALASFFFMAQHARMTGVAMLAMVLAAGHRVGVEIFLKARK